MGKNIKALTTDSTWETQNVTSEDLQTSCLMRIADASEGMAKSSQLMAQKYIRLQNDLKFYQENFISRGKKIAQLEKSNAALRGVITRMKNKSNNA